jgi:hypothetical protein
VYEVPEEFIFTKGKIALIPRTDFYTIPFQRFRAIKNLRYGIVTINHNWRNKTFSLI